MTDNDSTGILSLNTVITGTLGVTVLYMIWLGVSGSPTPEWVYWISSIL